MRWQRCSIAFFFVLAVLCSAQIQRNQVRSDAYGVSWNGDRYRAGSADAVYDKIESLAGGVTAWLYAHDFGTVGNGIADDKTALQNAINAAIAQHKGLYIEHPSVAYCLSDGLVVTDAGGTVTGLVIQGLGCPHIRYEGPTGKTALRLDGVTQSGLINLWIDGNDIADVNGLSVRGTRSSQRDTFDHMVIQKCKKYAVDLVAGPQTVDYLSFRECRLESNYYGMDVNGPFQVDWHGGTILTTDKNALLIREGQVYCYNSFFSASSVADVNLADEGSVVKIYGGGTDSGKILVTSGDAKEGAGALAGTYFAGFHQNSLSPATPVIDYNVPDPLVLVGCKFQGNVQLGYEVNEVHSVANTFTVGDFNGFTERVIEDKTPIRTWSLTIDDPNSLVDPNLMMLPVDAPGYPHGIIVTRVALKTRGSTTYNLAFYDYNAPNDTSPALIGEAATSAGYEDANDVGRLTVPVGDIVVVRVPAGTGLNQLQAIVYGYRKAR